MTAGPSEAPKGTDDLLTWRRIGTFVRNVLKLERSIESLLAENKEMDQRVTELQRQLDLQSGQLKILLDFVNKALDERVTSRAEEASIRAFERMALLAGLKTIGEPRNES